MKNKEQIAKIWDVLDSLNVDVLHNKQAIIKLENEREQEPKLKQLDQSVFDGLDAKWRFAAVNEAGEVFRFTKEPKLSDSFIGAWVVRGLFNLERVGDGYDASNWQNSLIERESKELTGSDLTRSILSKQFMQACLVSDSSDEAALIGDDLQLIRRFDESGGKFISMRDPWYGCHHKYAVAVSNDRKPLTQLDVGL